MSDHEMRFNIARDLSITEPELNRLILRAPHTYKVYTIPKKSGGRRVIAQPAKETKYIQYWLMENILKYLPLHLNATAYKKGASIKNNALAHVNNTYFTKLDFKAFFTSIKINDLIIHLHEFLGDKYSQEEIYDIARVSCIQYRSDNPLCLSIGAPSSPMLSNSILYEFDLQIADWCAENKVVYTRYADDLTFSTKVPRTLNMVETLVRKIAGKIEYPNLKLNRKKTIHLSKKNQRRVTGLIITNEKKISIGRKRKREISTLIHRYTLNLLGENQIHYLQGLLGFSLDMEPEFIVRMRIKYGQELVTEILKKRTSPF